MSKIPGLKFDSHYLYDEIADFLQRCDEASDLISIESIGESPEGRSILLAILTDPATGSPEDKPAYYVQANVHAQEMCGTAAALRLIHTLLTDDSARRMLRDMAFYVVPRVCVDGAELVLTMDASLRSRWEVEPRKNGVVPEDINGDGRILHMRWEDPAGPYAQDPEDPRLLVPRRPGDEGPFFQQAIEGLVHDYDGGPLRQAVRNYDFNRNYPVNWDGQTDRADYPFAHPETRAVGTFLLEHPNVFAGIDFHGGTPAILRPSSKPDAEMNQSDLGTIIEIGRMAEDIIGFKLMNVRDYRETWRQPIVLRGNSNDFAYFELGISWYVIELGFGYSSAGVTFEEMFGERPEVRERDFLRRIMAFADEHPDRDIFGEWEDFDHPQLGPVQIGGLAQQALSGIYPPEMEGISERTTQFLLKHAAMRPELVISAARVQRVAEDVFRIRARLANVGFFSTDVMSTGTAKSASEPAVAELEGIEADDILSRHRTYEFANLHRSHEVLEWFVRAKPDTEIRIVAHHPRAGRVSHAVTLA